MVFGWDEHTELKTELFLVTLAHLLLTHKGKDDKPQKEVISFSLKTMARLQP